MQNIFLFLYDNMSELLQLTFKSVTLMCSKITQPATCTIFFFCLVPSTLERLAKLKWTSCRGFKGLSEGWQSCRCVNEAITFLVTFEQSEKPYLLSGSRKSHKRTFWKIFHRINLPFNSETVSRRKAWIQKRIYSLWQCNIHQHN